MIDKTQTASGGTCSLRRIRRKKKKEIHHYLLAIEREHPEKYFCAQNRNLQKICPKPQKIIDERKRKKSKEIHFYSSEVFVCV